MNIIGCGEFLFVKGGQVMGIAITLIIFVVILFFFSLKPKKKFDLLFPSSGKILS